MNETRSILLNGISPHDLDARIQVTEIVEHEPQYLRTVRSRCLDEGSVLTENRRICLQVTVKLVLRESRPAERARLLGLLADWASGGMLEIGQRPDRRLKVTCESFPGYGNTDWTREISIRFAARQTPWWEQKQMSRLFVTDTINWYVPGCGTSSPLSYRITNRSQDTLTRVTLDTGITRQTFDGLLLTPGGILTVITEDGIQKATITTPSSSMDAERFMTGDSSDVLMIPCGISTAVTLTADRQAAG